MLMLMLSFEPPFDFSTLSLFFVVPSKCFLFLVELFNAFFLMYSVIMLKSFLLSSSSSLNSLTYFSNSWFISSFFSISLIKFYFTFSNLLISCFWESYIYCILLFIPLRTVLFVDWLNLLEEREGIESSWSSLESFVVVVASMCLSLREEPFLELTEIELIDPSILI